jgi:hypothetical protein
MNIISQSTKICCTEILLCEELWNLKEDGTEVDLRLMSGTEGVTFPCSELGTMVRPVMEQEMELMLAHIKN